MNSRWIALVLWPVIAGAEPLRIRTTGALPFELAELSGALALRTQLAQPGARSLEVVVAGAAGSVHVNVGDRERDVGLDGTQGIEAARLVAYAILDLAGDQLDPPHDAMLAIEQHVVVRAVEQPSRLAVAVWGHGGSRNEAELELGVRVHGDLRAIVSGGSSQRTTIGGMVSTRTWPLRAGVAWRGLDLAYGQLEVRATALAVVENASASRSQTETMFGGGAAVAWAAPLAGRVTVLMGGGVDGVADPIEYRVTNVHAATTPRVTWWAGLGLAVEVWP